VSCAWGELLRTTTVAADAEVDCVADVTVPPGKALTIEEGATI
jgi:hypothetical protein